MLGLNMYGGRVPGRELAALTGAVGDDEAGVVTVVDEDGDKEEGTVLALLKPNASRYI